MTLFFRTDCVQSCGRCRRSCIVGTSCCPTAVAIISMDPEIVRNWVSFWQHILHIWPWSYEVPWSLHKLPVGSNLFITKPFKKIQNKSVELDLVVSALFDMIEYPSLDILTIYCSVAAVIFSRYICSLDDIVPRGTKTN